MLPVQPLGFPLVLKPGRRRGRRTTRDRVASRPRVKAAWVGERWRKPEGFVRGLAWKGGGGATGDFPWLVTGRRARPGNRQRCDSSSHAENSFRRSRKGLDRVWDPSSLFFFNLKSFVVEHVRLGQRQAPSPPPPPPLNSLKENRVHTCARSHFILL